jgi:hypothetical protein
MAVEDEKERDAEATSNYLQPRRNIGTIFATWSVPSPGTMKKKTPWPLVRKRTIPTERPPPGTITPFKYIACTT